MTDDLLIRAADAVQHTLAPGLTLESPVAALLRALALALVVGALATGAAGLDRRLAAGRAGGRRRLALEAAYGAAALGALGLLAWLCRHPSHDLASLSVRFDHLAFAVLAGLVLRRLPGALRLGLLAGLSLVLIGLYLSWSALAPVVAVCLVGYAATRWPTTRRPGIAVPLHAFLVVGLVVWLFAMRDAGLWTLQALGLFFFVGFRYLSHAVEAGRAPAPSVAGYLCFLFFYPSCIGAMEVFREFRDQNLLASQPIDYRRGALRVVQGAVLMWIGIQVSIDESAAADLTGFSALWGLLLLAFLRAAFFLTGFWATLEAGALFLGIRLRPNFSGILTARSPSAFWRSWRGTMANWFIRHVYVPLGGGRRHRTANILVVFAVSSLWHAVGILSLRPDARPVQFLPVAIWGLVNFVGVAGHASLRRLLPPRSRGRLATIALEAPKLVLTYAFGALSIAMLGFPLDRIERLAPMLRAMVGLSGW